MIVAVSGVIAIPDVGQCCIDWSISCRITVHILWLILFLQFFFWVFFGNIEKIDSRHLQEIRLAIPFLQIYQDN